MIFQGYYTESPICFNLLIRSEKFPGWIYSFFISGILLPVNSIVIVAFYICIFLVLRKSWKKLKKGKSSNDKLFEKFFAKNFLIVFSNIISWLPVCLLGFQNIPFTFCFRKVNFFSFIYLGILSIITKVYFSDEAFSMIVICFLSLNSLINPIIHLISDYKISQFNKNEKKKIIQLNLIEKEKKNVSSICNDFYL